MTSGLAGLNRAPREAAVVVCGPTASGKSKLAFELAEHIDAEIISADSAQVYRGMDIGTAKPSQSEQAMVPHHLIDVRDPDDPFSAADFRAEVLKLVPEIIARGNLPLIVGGTMLYLKALKEGLARLPEAEPAIREQILDEAQREGWEALHQQLQSVDPEAAARIKPSDTQRLQRALEVYRVTGEPLTQLQKKSGEPCPFPLVELAVVPPDRRRLHEVIESRFHAMLAAGFVDEVRRLHEQPALSKTLPSIKAVGYRQCWTYLDGEIDEQTMINQAVAATRQLAKRQFTWLRSWQDLHVMPQPDLEEALKILRATTIFRG